MAFIDDDFQQDPLKIEAEIKVEDPLKLEENTTSNFKAIELPRRLRDSDDFRFRRGSFSMLPDTYH